MRCSCTGISPQIDAFITDFPSARLRALALDQQILQDARAVSQDYADLVSLAARQIMAGIEITVAAEKGGYDRSDVLAFMKDVGNSQ
jgi:predicted lysophospholipase L1 biosynthesis ABC-type transport system permease subunit